ncbi:Na/Pi cotransporter family protein [Pollutimonas sp. M17]|uniref:Na/Pi cotransporter family protein n=1 Tax=Pollutimonas sp. M17 TaxID=2962065 RepID=UPI0021F47F69|nr:Na/Pi cotransporter family protein [Pollutimonas sp. M17]UYO92622.1 Na/Pi cotransporter family protein [Pollutimonas sp. M17]HWK69689.1 Na/Pi cotransporter family protein [Burkholderiaceae bacterium]
MTELFALLNFGGYIALLLWGVHMVQSGVQRAFGAALRIWMGRALGTRVRAFFTGLAITSAIQSSTATGLMITSFAAGGLVALTPGLAAMLGANVGTTIIVQLLSFNLTALAPTLILIGVWLFRRHQPSRRRDLGRVFIGLGLLLLSLHELVLLFAPLQDARLLEILLDALSGQPVIALLLAAILAWASHSSVAVVVLIMSLASHDMIEPSLAYALVLGANLGTSVNPLLEGAGDDDPAARRLPLGNLGTRLAGCLLALVLLPWLPTLMGVLSADPARAVANFHTLFNVAVALLFLPLLTPYARVLVRVLPKRSDPNDPSRPQYLDESAHEVPAIALGNAAREALRVADMTQSLLGMARAGFLRDNRHRIAHARYVNSAIDRLDGAITTYLATLDQDAMNQDDHRRLDEILAFSSNMAHAGNIATSGLLGHTATLRKKGWAFTAAQRDELTTVLDRLMRNQRQTAALFVAEDIRSARYLAFEKDHFRELEATAAERNLQNIQAGRLDQAELGSFYLDILRDAKTVNSFLVEAAAYPILAKHNELLPNRLRENSGAPE